MLSYLMSAKMCHSLFELSAVHLFFLSWCFFNFLFWNKTIVSNTNLFPTHFSLHEMFSANVACPWLVYGLFFLRIFFFFYILFAIEERRGCLQYADSFIVTVLVTSSVIIIVLKQEMRRMTGFLFFLTSYCNTVLLYLHRCT